MLESVKRHIHFYCMASIDWLKSLEHNHKVDALKNALTNILDRLRSHEVFIRVVDHVHSFKYVMFKEGTIGMQSYNFIA